MLNVAKIYPA